MGNSTQWVYDRDASAQRSRDRATLRAAQRTSAAIAPCSGGGEDGRTRVSDADRERVALCEHQWRVVSEPVTDALPCVRPVRLTCVGCSWSFVKRCGSARTVKCGPCADTHRADVAAVGRSGWSDQPSSRGIWLTLTAPGTDALPFDSQCCTHGPATPCSGSAGCRVEREPLALWHAELSQNWSWFVTDVRRLLNPGLTGPPSSWPVRVEFFKTYEPQKRGALHIHAMVRIDGVCTVRRFHAACRLARSRHGFGPQMKSEPIDLGSSETAARVAGYCAKYATKSADELPDVTMLNWDTGEVTHGGLRSWSASRRWGTSMAAVKHRRTIFARGLRSSPALGSVQPTTEEAPPLDSYREIYADDGSPGPINCPP